ncbi:M1-specific T cell receptor beta chain-like [Polyodon spathula]|uniref:M1-specific T cell receptor beta chain-like n=1 Tax=Polyodon spathula TaxID=7913 RepID=UPI001B7F4230|nr:M1-specific T cell receptor beta chain-like [Polyodon spathula]
MKAVIILISALAAYSSSIVDGEDQKALLLRQPHPSVTSPQGRNPKIRCLVERNHKVGRLVLSWYKKPPAEGMRLVLSLRSKSKASYGDGFSERFLPEIDEDSNSFSLTVGQIEQSDAGVYYCAAWYSNRYVFGEGTEMVVLGKQPPPRKPSLSVYPPAHKDLRERNLVLCLASRFFPKPVRISWTVNGAEPALPGSQVPEPLGNGDGTFSAWSLLELSGEAWHEGARVTCQVEHESITAEEPLTRSTETKSKRCKRGHQPSGSQTGGNWIKTSDNSTDYSDADLERPWGILKMASCCYTIVLVLSAVYGIVVSAYIFKERREAQGKRCEPEPKLNAKPRGPTGNFTTHRRKAPAMPGI